MQPVYVCKSIKTKLFKLHRVAQMHKIRDKIMKDENELI